MAEILYTINPPPFVFGCYDVTDNNKDRFLSDLSKSYYNMNDRYHCESERLKTFQNWPLYWLDKNTLALTGMFYTGDSDKVKCYFCEVEIGRWEADDDIVTEHLKWSPNCPFLRRRTTNNASINPELLNEILPPVSYDICGANDTIQLHNTIVNATSSSSTSSLATATATATSAAAVATAAATTTTTNNNDISYFPMYPEYAIEAARLRSFTDWPLHMKQRPEQLAESGFFYIGVGDRVKCYSCGGGLKDWSECDDPWEQHALWLSKCRFLKLIKGQNYIDAMIEKFNKEQATQTTIANSIVIDDQQQQQQQQNEAASSSSSSSSINNNSNNSGNDGINNENDVIKPSVQQQSIDVATTINKIPAATIAEQNIDATTTATSTAIVTSSSTSEMKKSTATTEQRHICEEKLCKICYADEYNTAFLPCGHVVACAKCASSVTKCPLCRKPFTDVMRVYFP